MINKEKGAGGVIITSNYENLNKWVITSINDQFIESHGHQYSQQFVSQKVNDSFSVCFYLIKGYKTIDENIAFEHAEFTINEFLDVLEENSPDIEYLAFADVGSDIDETELIGFNYIHDGLGFFNTNLAKIRSLKSNCLDVGEVIWEI